MTLRIANAPYMDEDPYDPIIWERQASWIDEEGQVRFVIEFCRQSDKDRLIHTFGEAWFSEHLLLAERRLSRLNNAYLN